MRMSKETINFLGLGIELVGLLIGGVVVGGKIDEHYNFNGTAMIGGILLALITWFMHVFKAMKRMEKSDENQQ